MRRPGGSVADAGAAPPSAEPCRPESGPAPRRVRPCHHHLSPAFPPVLPHDLWSQSLHRLQATPLPPRSPFSYFSGPGWMMTQNALVHRAAGYVGTRQVADAHEELAHDLTSGEAKGLLEELHPVLLAPRMMCRQPGSKGTMGCSQFENASGIADGGIHLQPIADD